MENNITALLLYLLGPMLLLGLLALFLPRGRRRKQPRQPTGSMRALTLTLAGIMGLCWLASMAVLTLVTADQFFQRFAAQSAWAPDWAASNCRLEEFYTASDNVNRLRYAPLPERMETQIFEGLAQSVSYPLITYDRTDWRLGLTEARSGAMETAVLFLGPEGEILWGDRDVLWFCYAAEAEGGIGVTQRQKLHFGWVDLGTAGKEGPFKRLYDILRREGSLQQEIQLLRVTGALEGNRFRPASLEILSVGTLTENIREGSLPQLEKAGKLDWEPVFRDGTVSGELVTVYGRYPEMYAAGNKALAIPGRDGGTERFDSLRDFLLARMRGETPPLDLSRNLRACLALGSRSFRSEEETGPYRTDFTLVTAAYYRPLASALRTLWPVYLFTAVLCLVLALLLLRLLRRRLVEPVTDVLEGMAGEWYDLCSPEGGPDVWREAAALYDRYRAEQDRRRHDLNELRRLEKALDYAKAAEEERRLLTSNLAHELKTPLAVVHSYAEGLKAHIAEEKREQYLDIILSESERMDVLVMRMLDLSRLEAGKVKLSRDAFDLRALAEAVTEKLSPLAAERGVTVALEPGEACAVTADEGRISQAAENLLTNALRYSPAGSRVLVRVEPAGKQVRFRVENPVERPFSLEEQEKVWEPFWRRDKARGGEGTGLGLPIVKQIVELHGGTCAVGNMAGGVEFSFTLPR